MNKPIRIPNKSNPTRDKNFIVEDLQRITYDSPVLEACLDKLYHQHVLEGKPYRELFMSQLFGNVKYLMVTFPNEFRTGAGVIQVTDLDTNITYTL